MQKLTGFEGTYYPNRWEHNGRQICELNERVYLLFNEDHDVERRFDSLEDAETWLDAQGAARDDLTLALYEECYKAHEIFRALSKEDLICCGIDTQKALARFGGLYTVIEKAGLDDDYQEWKKLNKKGE